VSYVIKLIPIRRKEELADRFGAHTPYEVKSDVYGCCIKLLTDTQSVAARWGQSFLFLCPKHTVARTPLCRQRAGASEE